MQVMGTVAWVGLAEPMHLLGAVRRVLVTQLRQLPKAIVRGGQILDPHQNVDHRLRNKPWHRGAPDVMDPAGDPRPDRRPQKRLLRLKPIRPRSVVGDDPHRLVINPRVTCHGVQYAAGLSLRSTDLLDAMLWPPELSGGDQVAHRFVGHRRMPDWPAGLDVYLRHELVRRAAGEIGQALDTDAFKAGQHSRSAQANREHLASLGLTDRHGDAKFVSMLASSRFSDAYWSSNSSAGISAPWNIVKLYAARP